MIGDQIKLLRKIQHLALIRDEESKVGAGTKGEELTARMLKLVSELEPAAAGLYQRLSKRSRIFISPVTRGSCSACGMKLPTAEFQRVMAQDRFMVCGGCGRVLYVPEVKSTGVRTAEADPKFLLSRFSTAKLMLPNLKATTPEEAMKELASTLEQEKVIADSKSVVKAALERESILTTAVGHGLAFPHMRGVEEGALTFACGSSAAGIDWGGEKVHLVFFSTLPIVASPFYLRLLSALSSTFEDGEKLPFVLAAGDSKTFWKELNKVTRVAVKNMAA